MGSQRSSCELRIGASSSHDREIIQRLDELAATKTFGHITQAFPGYLRRVNLTRFLAYYELFRMIKSKPGWIVECGVYRGFSLFALAKFMEIFCMGDKTRKVLGFENFCGFTEVGPEDGGEREECLRVAGGASPAEFREEFMELLDICNRDAFAPWVDRVLLVEGNVEDTVPAYVATNPGLRISLLHLDIDLYSPTTVCLESLYPLVVPGGLVVLDEYAHVDWGGASKAVEDYLGGIGLAVPDLHTFSWVGTPTAYFTKPGPG